MRLVRVTISPEVQNKRGMNIYMGSPNLRLKIDTFDKGELHRRLRVKVELDLGLPLLEPLRGRGGRRGRRLLVGSENMIFCPSLDLHIF